MRSLAPACRLLAVLSTLLLAASSAHTQAIEVYGTFTPVHLTDVRNGNNTTGANNGFTTASYWAPGFGGGATFGILPVGPVRIGFDVRGSSKPGSNGADTVMGGVKVGLRLPLLKLHPYVEGAGGYLATRTKVTTGAATGSVETDHFAAYEILGGVDYPVLPFVALRLVEVGGGKGYNVSGVGDTAGNYTVSLFTVSTGVVFHF